MRTCLEIRKFVPLTMSHPISGIMGLDIVRAVLLCLSETLMALLDFFATLYAMPTFVHHECYVLIFY